MKTLAVLVLATAVTGTAMTLWVNNEAVTLRPPGSSCTIAGFSTIQAAVGAATAGDIVAVCPGTYPENVTIDKSNLTVASTGGATVTIVTAPLSYHVFQITQPGVTLQGFTIVPAGSADGDIGVNVAIEGYAGTVLARNVIRGGRIGINLGCASASSTVAHNVLRGASEAGINIDTCEIDPFPGSDYNSVHHNSVCAGGYAYSIAAGQGSEYNHIHHNIAIWMSVAGSGNHVHNNTAELFLIGSGNFEHNNTVANVCGPGAGS